MTMTLLIHCLMHDNKYINKCINKFSTYIWRKPRQWCSMNLEWSYLGTGAVIWTHKWYWDKFNEAEQECLVQMKTWGSLQPSTLLQWEVPRSDWTSWIAPDKRKVGKDREAECSQDSFVSELIKFIDQSSKGRITREEGIFICCFFRVFWATVH